MNRGVICYEQIRDNYWYGAFNEFKLVMMKDNGWVNATKLCKDGGKFLKNWLANKDSKAIIKSLEFREQAYGNTQLDENALGDPSAGIPAEASIVCKFVKTVNHTEVDKVISGTYIHPT